MAFSLNILPQWKGKYPMSDTAHADDLQMRADIYQHMHRLPQHEAEARAHSDYRKEQIEKAAAHHWNGMKASHAAGNEEAAKKHGVMYTLALHQLGHKDLLNPPPEVLEAAKDPKQAIGHFKAHPADAYSMPPQEPSEEQPRNRLEPHVKGAPAKTSPLGKAEDGAPGSNEPARTEEVPVSQSCSVCKGPFHPATGHQPMDGVRVCGPCTRHLVDWLKVHTRRPYGSKETPFYEAAKTSIKPGMSKSEIIDYPSDHRLGMEVPEGGSNCAKCSYVSDDLKKCANEEFRKWNGGAELPKPADRYCCDLYEIGGKK